MSVSTVVQTAEFDYHLPPELIAQHPAARREESRLLVVDRAKRRIEHRRFFELPEFLRAGDLLLRNTARVRPARLFARRPGGGRVECLLLRPAGNAESEAGRGDRAREGSGTPAGESGEGVTEASSRPPAETWWCLLRPGRRLPPGASFGVAGEFSARVLAKSATAEYRVAFTPARAGESVATLAERLGHVPLPPYIQRSDTPADAAEGGGDRDDEDRSRYQTVFADRAHTVAVAAPTAGLHFSEALLARIVDAGVTFADVVLHVGLGTFRPISTEEVAAHAMHRERIEIPAATRARLAESRSGRRIAVGTTSVRAVEHYGRLEAAGVLPDAADDIVTETDLFIHPPAEFRFVDALITNFHLPRSTLLCMVAAFLTPGSTDGVAWLREIYAEAVRERYRFLSYGDAMLIV